MNRAKNSLITLLGISLLGVGLLVKGSNLTAPPTGTWLPAGTMASPRTGATAVLLNDGRVLMTGGTGTTSPLSTVEFLNSDGSFTAAPSLNFARSGHTATLLQDGRVLVAGGTGATGSATETAEIYDPAANTWTAAGPLMMARSGHTATLLANGKVLLAGGSANPSAGGLASLELFDPTSNSFTLAASTLSAARESHAATVLPDGRVLIVGGWDGTTGAPVPPATTGTPNVLASSDIYDPATGLVSAGPALSSGTPKSQNDGILMVAGGNDATGSAQVTSEVYGFAWVKTDLADYPPNTTVNFTGSGWKPGETVQLSLVEVPDLDSDSPISLTATADANGNISNSSFSTDMNDVAIRFTLTAVGSASQAQMTFTDKVATTTTVSCSPAAVSVGQSTICTATTTPFNTANVHGQEVWSVSPSNAGTFSSDGYSFGLGPAP